MNTIFLDIDGVVHPYVTISRLLHPLKNKVKKKEDLPGLMAEKLGKPILKDMDPDLCAQVLNGFSQEACAYIRALAEEFQAQIVVTSSWAVFCDLHELKQIFALFDLDEKIVEGLRSSRPRAISIENYVQEHDLTSWLVIDDLDMKDIFQEHQIKTYDSFKEADYEEARRFFLSRQGGHLSGH